MEPFQSRVVEEKRDLDEKIAKLETFIQEGTYQSLPSDERGRLAYQLSVMNEYSNVLAERINAFGPLKFTVRVNGLEKKITEQKLRYEDLVVLAGYSSESTPSCTYGYIGEQKAGGILHSGDTLHIVGNESFTIVYTGNA